MLQTDNRFAILCLVLFFCTSISAFAGRIGPSDKCEGLAQVHLKSGLYGSIYIDPSPNQSGRFSRRGYLPSGTVITLEPPFGNSKADHKADYCGFRFRNSVRGQVARAHLFSLESVIAALEVDVGQIRGFAAPANPDLDRPLVLYETPDLSVDRIVTELGRSDLAVMVLLKDLPPHHDVLRALYVADPEVSPADSRIVFLDKNLDRCCSSAGTYRLFHPIVDMSEPAPAPARDAMGHLVEFVSSIVTDARQSVVEAIEGSKEEVAKLVGCGVGAELTTELNLKSGFNIRAIGVELAGQGQLTLEKPADQAMQFTTVGDPSGLLLRFAGTAACSRSGLPSYLQSAFVTPQVDDRVTGFVIDREEFFAILESSSLLPPLEEQSRVSNADRDLSPIIVVPKKDGERTAFYFTLFDQVERFMSRRVFGTALGAGIAAEDRFAVTLLVFQTISFWENSS